MPTPEEIAAQKAADEAKKAAEAQNKPNGDDAEIDAILSGGKDAVKRLLESKRSANAEAKELRLKQEAADKVKKDQEEAALKEQNKFKELAEKKESDLNAANSKFAGKLIAMSLRTEAMAAGSVDPDAVVALADRAGIKVGDDFEVSGAKEAVEALKKSKAYLFSATDPKVAPPTTGLPSPRGGFLPAEENAKSDPLDRISRGLAGKKQ